jgi:8-oxo-dGTP diphosphatase
MAEIEILARGVCVRNGKLLVCHTRGSEIVYLPGGHVEFGEGAEKAVCREIREEMGRRSRVKRFLGCVEHAFRQKGRKHVELNVVFEVEIAGLVSGRAVEAKEGHLDFGWVPMKALGKSVLEPACLRPLLAGWLKRPGQGAWASSVR